MEISETGRSERGGGVVGHGLFRNRAGTFLGTCVYRKLF